MTRMRGAHVMWCALVGVGCSASGDAGVSGIERSSAVEPLQEVSGRPYDVSHARIHYASRGDRFDVSLESLMGAGKPAVAPVQAHHRRHPAKADWNYNLGAAINGGSAVWVTNQTTGLPSCTDALYVPVNGTTNNLVAFTNLYDTCTNTAGDPLCSPSPAGHCPTVLWKATISGKMDRNSVAVSPNGSVVYVSTTTGRLAAVNTAAAAATRVAWTLDATVETGNAAATFVGSTPWVDYPGGNIYTAVRYGNSPFKIRVYKLSPAGAVLAKIDVQNDGIQSGVLFYNGFVYFGSTTGKVYKIQDNGASFTAVGGVWPLALSAETSVNGTATPVFGQPIYGTPTIDGTNNIMFVDVNNVMWSVLLTTGATNSIEMGWTTGAEAQAGNVPCYSSPFLYSDANVSLTVFAAHGKNQGNGSTGPRLHRRNYATTGVFNAGTLTSMAAGSSADLSYPRSSPIVFQPTAGGPVYTYVGDDSGRLLRWTYTNAGFAAAANFTIPTAPQEIDSPIIVDTANGNIYFGSNNGRIYQINQSSLQ